MTLRQEVNSIHPDERLDYLLSLLDPETEEIAELMTYFPGVSPRSAQLFLMLWRRVNTVVSYDTLLVGDPGSTPQNRVATPLKHLRRQLKEANWPVEISTYYGIGVKLTCPWGWSWKP